jgi:hypothetical protein
MANDLIVSAPVRLAPGKSGCQRSGSQYPEFLKSVEHSLCDYACSVHLVLMSCHKRYDCFRNLLAAN